MYAKFLSEWNRMHVYFIVFLDELEGDKHLLPIKAIKSVELSG